jgi:hypothetical protein
LRSALVLATTAANVVFWTWPVAPPRFAVPGMTDILVRFGILGAGSPHGPDSLVNLYAAMPSLHVAWAAWCAAALVAATRGRRRHLAWLYPAATTLVVIATANHFLADAAAGLAVTALGLLAARAATRPDATGPGPGGAGPAAASPAQGPGAATPRRRPAIWWRRLARRWGWAAGALAVLAAAAARWWLLAGAAATLAVVTEAATAARRAGGAARWLARHAGRSRCRWLSAAGLAGLARHRIGPRRGAAALAASGLSVPGEAGLLAAAFGLAGTPVPWRGLLLAGAAGQLGARLVPLPGGLGGMEGGVPGALALTGTRPATALAAVIVYRVAGYWAPGAVGAITAAVLTRRHPAQAARPPGPLRPQAPPDAGPGAAAQPTPGGIRRGARAARPWPAPGRPARPGLKPAHAHPTAGPASRTPQAAAGHAASARSPPEPGRPVPPPGTAAAPRPFPARHERHGASVIVRRQNEEKKGTNMS